MLNKKKIKIKFISITIMILFISAGFFIFQKCRKDSSDSIDAQKTMAKKVLASPIEPSTLILEITNTSENGKLSEYYRYVEERSKKAINIACSVSLEQKKESGENEVIKTYDFRPCVSYSSDRKTELQKLLIRSEFLSMTDNIMDHSSTQKKGNINTITEFRLTLKYPGWSYNKTVVIEDIDELMVNAPEKEESYELKFILLYLKSLVIEEDREKDIRRYWNK